MRSAVSTLHRGLASSALFEACWLRPVAAAAGGAVREAVSGAASARQLHASTSRCAEAGGEKPAGGEGAPPSSFKDEEAQAWNKHLMTQLAALANKAPPNAARSRPAPPPPPPVLPGGDDAGVDLSDPMIGFSELGKAKTGAPGTPGRVNEDYAPPAVHPQRLFWPGTRYSPADLHTFRQTRPEDRARWQQRVEAPITNEEVTEKAHFRNVPFLLSFLTETGHLKKRVATKLQRKVHKKLIRKIKTARCMALLPTVGRPQELTRARYRDRGASANA